MAKILPLFLIVYSSDADGMVCWGPFNDKTVAESHREEQLDALGYQGEERRDARNIFMLVRELEPLTTNKKKLFLVLEDEPEEGPMAYGPFETRKEAEEHLQEVSNEYDEDDGALNQEAGLLRIVEISNPNVNKQIPA